MRRYLLKDEPTIKPDENVIKLVEEFVGQEVKKNRYYADGMFYRNDDNYFRTISAELDDPEPSPVLLNKLRVIFNNVARAYENKDKEAASTCLSQEFGVAKKDNTARTNKIIGLAITDKKDSEIEKHLDINASSVTNALGAQKNPKNGTPRYEVMERLLDSDLFYKTVHEVLYFLNRCNGKELDVFTKSMTDYLIEQKPYFLIKYKHMHDYVSTVIKHCKEMGLVRQYRYNIKITSKGLKRNHIAVLNSLPVICSTVFTRRGSIAVDGLPTHRLHAYKRAEKAGLIILENNVYKSIV